MKKKTTTFTPIILLFICFVFTACNQSTQGDQGQPSFKSVMGIRFTEVRRTVKTGVAFNKIGFYLEPSWKLTFVSADSVYIYSPEKKRFFNCPVIFDHDSIFNIAWAWIKVKKVTKDSLKFQVLEVENKQIMANKSRLFMTLYSDAYIKNVLHSTAEALQRPTHADTAYIKLKTKQAAQHPDSAFAALQPVSLTSKSPAIRVKQMEVQAEPLNDIDIAENYLSPEFNIAITKAYDNFDYSFSAIVDQDGQLHFGKSLIAQDWAPEFKDAQIRVMTAIMNGYLKHYLAITPGKTLGIAHASKIILHVKGSK